MDVGAYKRELQRLLVYMGMDIALTLADMIINEARTIIKTKLFDMDEFPIYTLGNLYQSLSFYVIPSYKGVELYVMAKTPYAKYVEFGTNPHPVPYEVIEVWAEEKGLEPKEGLTWEQMIYKIVEHIREEGTKEKPFFRLSIGLAEDKFDVSRVKWSDRTLELAKSLGVEIKVGGA